MRKRSFTFKKTVFILTGILLMTFVAMIPPNEFAAGQTDRLPKGKFYKNYGKKIPAGENRVTVHLPVGFDEIARAEYIPASREQVFAPLLAAMTGYLDSLAWTTAVQASFPANGSPYVYIGSAEGETAPAGSEMQREEYDKYPPMIIYIQKPSSGWKKQLQGSGAMTESDFLLVINVSICEYPKADKGFFGKKVVLGTGYESGIKFLSAEDKPVEVLQVTGLLLDREGNIRRAGAEGIISEDTPFWAQIFDVKKSLDNEAVRKLLTETRREDLPGKPLAWKVALYNLSAQLLPNNQSNLQIPEQ